MEVMAERDCEELLGVDLVPRTSKSRIPHHTLPDFGGPVDNRSEGKEEEEEEVEGQSVNGGVSNGSLFGGSHEDSETPNGLSTVEHQLLYHPGENGSDHIVEDSRIPRSSYLETNHKYLEISENEIANLFSTATSETSNEDHGIGINGYGNGAIEADESSTFLEEPKVDITELEVEKVIKLQETHDLFCPNCNSCITKRVILRRRKRKIQDISLTEDDQEIVIPEPIQNPSPPETETTREPIQETKRDAFECLSCFSIFIPIGRGFKLIFGGRDLTTSDAPASVPEESGEEQRVESDSIQEQIPVNSQPELLPEQVVEPTLLTSSEIKDNMAVHADVTPQLPILVSMALPMEQTLPMKSNTDVGNKLPDECDNSGSDTKVQEKPLEILIQNSEAPVLPSTLYAQQEVTGTEKKDTGEQVVVSVHREPGHTVVSMDIPTGTSPETEPLLRPGTSATPAVEAVRDSTESELDIIKSMVYGGLLESIASLSVVTSAAGADAKTLNIVALGAANMFGGLFILAHNLRVLKHENSNERYAEVLGRPGHFTLHSAVAVMSYLVFGLIPPVIYGFSFRESDNRDYKLITVALASLLCILLLSLGKAHTRTHPRAYTKTLLYYVSLWVMVCGVSYVAGDILHFLLQKLGLFDSTSAVLNTPWASY